MIVDFKTHNELNEGLWGDIWKKVKTGARKFLTLLKRGLQRLGFGGKQKFKISEIASEPLREAFEMMEATGDYDLTSRIGLYHEHCVALKMAEILRDKGWTVRNQPGQLENKKKEELNKISQNVSKFRGPDQKKIPAELRRAEVGADLVAQKIVDDINTTEDALFLEFEIVHQGTAAMGLAKEDVELIVYKKGTDDVVDDIKASLKAYKNPSINLANKTFPSFLNGVLYPKTNLQGKKFLDDFLSKHPKYTKLIKSMTDVADGWKKIKKSDPKDGRKKGNAWVNQQQGFQKIRNGILQTIFDEAYSKDKKGINERVISTLGLDGADDVYMAIGTDVNNMKVVSSRSSAKFQKLYEAVKAQFTISFEFPMDPNVVNCKMNLTDDKTGENILTTTYSFKEGDIFVQFMDFKDFVE